MLPFIPLRPLYLLVSSHNYTAELTNKMVNWRAADAKDRLFASLLASHPTLKVRLNPLSQIIQHQTNPAYSSSSITTP